jgi:hypothetical protein
MWLECKVIYVKAVVAAKAKSTLETKLIVLNNIQTCQNQFYISRKENLQWKRCFERVSFGMNSATSNLSSPSQQQPTKLANRSLLNSPTALASS